MADNTPTRKLAAVLHADVVGYSRLMGEDEDATHRVVRDHCDAISATIRGHQGHVVHCIGDAVLADFATVTDALNAAVAIQNDFNTLQTPRDQRVQFRIGVHLGEIIVDGDEIYGDGVNVAVRLEGLAEPGGICISEAARSAVGTKLPIAFEFLGGRDLKNISEPTRAYRVVTVNRNRDVVTPCPYPGMVPFGPADAPYFYGRDDEIARMVQLLRHRRFIMVIGPSGSGKSSLVHAGLLPELENNRQIAGTHWLIRTMRPGQHPSETLADILDHEQPVTEGGAATIKTLLESNPPGNKFLLLVDQFEEVFTQVERKERSNFFKTLQELEQTQSCVLILTLRADFYPDLMMSPLWPIDASQRIEVVPLHDEA
ncbi:MAG: adenylate/guanylate cyclase domain-containing protein, partial [Geminicoccaceae bacterium]